MSDHGTFYWNELMTRDPDKIRKFYEDTIGWTFNPWNMNDGHTYWVAMAGERPVGGVFDMSDNAEMKDVPEHWMSYLSVDDIDARCAKAKEAGAVIMREPFDVPSVGRIAILQQPGGAVVGWMTPSPREDG